MNMTVLKKVGNEYKDIAIRQPVKSCNFRGTRIEVGDLIEIDIPKILKHTGEVIFIDGCFCIEYKHFKDIYQTPLHAYTADAELKILKKIDKN